MYFKEKQSFWSWWFIILMIFLIYSTVSVNFYEMINTDFSSQRFNLTLNPGFWIVGSIIVFFLFVRLKTEITSDGISITYFPFLLKRKFIAWNEINEVFVEEYNPISDQGGWGYRTENKGKAYNTSGKIGLQLILKNGEKLLKDRFPLPYR